MIFAIDLEIFNSFGNKTIRFLGQYHTIGSPLENHGKIPFLYANINLSEDKSPPKAIIPSLEVFS